MAEKQLHIVIRELQDSGQLSWLEAAGVCRSWRMWLSWFDYWQARKKAHSRRPQDDTIRYFTDLYAVRGGVKSTTPFSNTLCGNYKLPILSRIKKL